MSDDLPSESGVYLLHFDKPYPNGRKPQHYMGWAQNLRRRVAEHSSGSGSCLMQACKQQGVTFTVAALWIGETRTDERRRKNRKRLRDFCPICRAEKEKKKCGSNAVSGI